MTTLERIRRLAVNATSPKLLVVATVDGAGAISVRFAENAVPGPGEETLAAELTAAVRGALAGYRKGLTNVFGGDPMAAEHPRFPPQHPVAKRRRRLAEAAEQLSVQGTSPNRVVQMRWRGVDRIDFRIKPGSLAESGHSRQRLTHEVDAVIAETTAKRAAAGRQLFDEIHRSPKER